MNKLRYVLFRPFQKFVQLQTSSSILLLLVTIIALAWANSPWAETYDILWHTPLTLGLGPYVFSESLHFWINDGLMAIFFFVVGLEIKRELLVGELSSRRQAMLPFIAAIGGMLVPALIYFLLNPSGSPYVQGWGIPTVTDIAFAIGVMAVLGNRVPLGLKVFLIALAIVDDLGAILLIALFYSNNLNWFFLIPAGGVMFLLWLLTRLDVDDPLPYSLLGIALWAFILNSGLHATIAGVLLAFMIPARSRINPTAFHDQACQILERFNHANPGPKTQHRMMMTNAEHQASVQELDTLCDEVHAPLQRLEHMLHPWVSYLILPLFALANAGVSIPFSGIGDALRSPLTIGIVAGLFFGKQLGITLFSWLAVKLRLAELPLGVRWSHIYGASILGGIGFTMSLFISVLAFTDPEHIVHAKIGILMASFLSGVIGTIVLARILAQQNDASPAQRS